MIKTLAFDGDDTLWHHESLYADTQAKLRAMLAPHIDAATLDETLYTQERDNLALFGYGIKGFMLSMVETAISVSGGRVTADEIHTIIGWGKDMLAHPVVLIDGVERIVRHCHGRVRLLVITKGDLFDQEGKVARSGLADLFDAVEIVSEKDERTYARILDGHGVAPADFLMVGNSMRSDILPVLALGAQAVHIPYRVTWAHEHVAAPADAPVGFHTLDSVDDLPGLLDQLGWLEPLAA